jgi:hypothetical protein
MNKKSKLFVCCPYSGNKIIDLDAHVVKEHVRKAYRTDRSSLRVRDVSGVF